MKPRFLVFIPGYNCAPQIGQVFEGLKSCEALVDEVLFVENRSQDSTLEVALAARKSCQFEKLTILQNAENYGLGGSHKVAFRYALERGFDYLIILHGDNQADPREVPLFIRQALENPGVDAVLGDRFSAGSKLLGYSKLRTYGNIGISWIYSLLTLQHVRDLGAGLNLIRVERLKTLDFESCSDYCDFHTQLLLDMLRSHWFLRYQPITWKEEGQKSNINPFVYGLTTLKILLNWRFHRLRKSDFPKRQFNILQSASPDY